MSTRESNSPEGTQIYLNVLTHSLNVDEVSIQHDPYSRLSMSIPHDPEFTLVSVLNRRSTADHPECKLRSKAFLRTQILLMIFRQYDSAVNF